MRTLSPFGEGSLLLLPAVAAAAAAAAVGLGKDKAILTRLADTPRLDAPNLKWLLFTNSDKLYLSELLLTATHFSQVVGGTARQSPIAAFPLQIFHTAWQHSSQES